MSTIIAPLVKQLLAFLPQDLVSFITDFLIYWLVGLAIIFAVLRILLTKPDPSLLFYSIGINLGIVDLFFVFALIFYSVVLSYSFIDPYICTVSNFITLSQLDPNLEQRCVDYQKAQIPASKKEGTSTPLDVSFGYSSQGEQPYIPNVYTGMSYSLPITIKNVDKEVVTGIVVKGYIKNDTCIVGVDCIELKAQSVCSTDNPCDIPAEQSLQITLQSDSQVVDKANTFVDFYVQVIYPEMGYGTGNLYIVRSLQDLQTLTRSQPQTKTGPLDVVIYFAPDFFLGLGYRKVNSGTETMFVAIANNGKGVGKLSNVLIYKIGTYENLQNVQCPIPWQKGQTIVENTQFDLQDIAIPKTANIQFTCTINIDSSFVYSLLNNLQSPYSTVVYASTVNYNYFETYVLEGQRVQKLG